jgi:hypothetical protein
MDKRATGLLIALLLGQSWTNTVASAWYSEVTDGGPHTAVESRADYLAIGSRTQCAEISTYLKTVAELGYTPVFVPFEEIDLLYANEPDRAIRLHQFLEHVRTSSGSTHLEVVLFGNDSIIPSVTYESSNSERPPSDPHLLWCGERFLDDISISRVPVSEQNQVVAYRDKVNLRLQKPSAPGKRLVTVADDGEPLFESFLKKMGRLHFSGWQLQEIHLSSMGVDAPQNPGERIRYTNDTLTPVLIEAISKSPDLVLYFGHGGLRVWAHEEILDSRISERMVERIDAGALSIYIAFTCLNGRFDNQRFPTIAERLVLLEGRGALVYVTSAGQHLSNEYRLFAEVLLSCYQEHPSDSLSKIVQSARRRYSDDYWYAPEPAMLFTVFGDGALFSLDGSVVRREKQRSGPRS